MKPGESVTLSENNKARMMEEAQRIVQEMRARGCSTQRDKASREQEEAHTREIFRIYLLVPFWHRDYDQHMGEMVQQRLTLVFGSSL